MSEVINAETKRDSCYFNRILARALELTEQTRIQGMSEPLPRGENIIGYWNDNLFWEAHYLKPGYFLALFYDLRQTKRPDPYTRAGLKGCQAWILKYDSQHSRWSVEVWNAELGNGLFSELARQMVRE
jgi:hypothetical protein